MSNYINVENEAVQAIIENAAWDLGGVTLAEKKESPVAEKETLEEEAEVHSCPLCESVLAEELSDERILEHIDALKEAISLLSEEDVSEEDADDDEDPEKGTRASERTKAAITKAKAKAAALKPKAAGA